MAKDVPSGTIDPLERDDLADIRYATPLSRNELPDLRDAVLDERDRLRAQQLNEQRRRLYEQLMGPQEPTASLRLGDLLAHHEQSETVYDPTSGRWVNVYGGVA